MINNVLDLSKCFECGNVATEKHHVVPRSKGGTKTIPLCAICHGKIHGVKRLNISELTKAALDAKKARLKAEGKPENWRVGKWNDEARAKGMKTRKENAETNQNTRKAKNYATMLRQQGNTFAKIAEILNNEGFLTANDKKFDKAGVKYLIEK